MRSAVHAFCSDWRGTAAKAAMVVAGGAVRCSRKSHTMLETVVLLRCCSGLRASLRILSAISRHDEALRRVASCLVPQLRR